jgi:Tfp pilus assembly protein PilO
MTIDRPIAIVLMIFAVIVLAFFFVVPEYNTFQSLRLELGQKNAEYNAEMDYYAAIAKVYDELQARKEDVAKIDDALPENPDLGPTIYYLQQTAKTNGLSIKNLFLSKSSGALNSDLKTSANVKNMVFSMSLSGSYTSLEGFMVSLEQSSRLFEISSISFGSQTKPPYDFNLQIKTFSY